MNGIILNFKEILTQKYCKFSGRASRSEYWYFVLAYMVVAIVLAVLMAVTGSGLAVALYYLYGLGTLLPCLGLTVRRLHDINKAGGWIFISLVPIVGSLILLYFLILDGTLGANRFGERPEDNAF